MWSTSLGEGRDILFVHGWTMDHRDEMRTYEPIFAARPAARPRWRRHYLDLPGMGRSPARKEIVDMDGMLEALVRFVAGRFGDGRFALAGTSAGGYLARGLLARMPRSIDGMLLRAPLVVPRDDRRDVDPIAPLIVDAGALDGLSADDALTSGEVLIQTPDYVRALREKMHDAVLPAQSAADHRYLEPIRQDPVRYAFSFDVDLATAPFDGPSLVVTGRHDSSGDSPRSSRDPPMSCSIAPNTGYRSTSNRSSPRSFTTGSIASTKRTRSERSYVHRTMAVLSENDRIE